MHVTFGDIAVGIGAASTLGAIIVWWVSKILDLRKEIIQLQMRADFQDKIIEEMKEDIEEVQNWYNNGRNN